MDLLRSDRSYYLYRLIIIVAFMVKIVCLKFFLLFVVLNFHSVCAGDFLTSRSNTDNWKFENVVLACAELDTTGRGVQNVEWTSCVTMRVLSFLINPINDQQFDTVFSKLKSVNDIAEILLPVSMMHIDPGTGSLQPLDVLMRKDSRLSDYLYTETDEDSDFTDSISVCLHSEDGQRTIVFKIKSYFKRF